MKDGGKSPAGRRERLSEREREKESERETFNIDRKIGRQIGQMYQATVGQITLH